MGALSRARNEEALGRIEALNSAHLRVHRARDLILRELHRHRREGVVRCALVLDAYYELEAAERELDFTLGRPVR